MKKLFCIICDHCRKIIPFDYELFKLTTGTDKHFCSEECSNPVEPSKKLVPEEE